MTEQLIALRSSQRRNQDFAFGFHSQFAAAVRTFLQSILIYPLLGLFVRLEIEGQGQIEGLDGPCIIIGNHTSHLDSLVALRALPRRLRGHCAVAAAADYWFNRPLLGFFVHSLFNAFPMVRSGFARASLEQAVNWIEGGGALLLFPEGTRSLNGEIQPFRKGIGWLVVTTGAPVIPLYISGAHALLPKGQWRIQPGTVKVKIGAPVMYARDASIVQVTRDLQAKVQALGGKNDGVVCNETTFSAGTRACGTLARRASGES